MNENFFNVKIIVLNYTS